MEDKKYLLSICIPTYNGASGSLKKVLDYTIPCVEKYPDAVELIVSDNCSTDNTPLLLEQYDNKPNCRFYRNERNLGFNGNMLLLVETYAKGEFCWIIGDDDVINQDAFGYLVQSLKCADYDFLSLGLKQIDNSVLEQEEMNHYSYSVKRGTYSEIMNENCSIRENTLATFMGASIFRKSEFLKVDKSIIDGSFDKFYTVFPNGYIFATAFYNKPCACIPQPVIYPIFHKKDWANKENSYFIQSTCFVDLYDYIVYKLKAGSIPDAHKLILFDAVMAGYARLLHHKPLAHNFCRCIVELYRYPKVKLTVIRNLFRKLIGLSALDIL